MAACSSSENEPTAEKSAETSTQSASGQSANITPVSNVDRSESDAAGPHAAVPGVARLDASGRADDLDLGRLLLGELNCVACHHAEPAQAAGGATGGAAAWQTGKGGPDLSEVGARVTPAYLREYLADPHAVKPGTTMPHVLNGLDEAARSETVEALTHFLVSQGGPIADSAAFASEREIETGRDLYHSVGCAACHTADHGETAAVPLAGLARKTTVEALTGFLADPHATRPSGRMPSLDLTDDEARRIAVYLLREQAAQSLADDEGEQPGLDYKYYERQMGSALPNFHALGEPTQAGVIEQFDIDIDGRRDDEFAIRYTGVVEIDREGDWQFHSYSDDGTKLYINGQLVVDNDGARPPQERSGTITLAEGRHEIVVEFFEQGGGEELAVSWTPPGGQKQAIPADKLFRLTTHPLRPVDHEPIEVDPALASKGGELFNALGCASCHNVEGTPSTFSAATFAELTLDGDGGCLAEDPAARPVDYALSTRQLQLLRTAVTEVDRTLEPLDAEQTVVHTLAAMNCYACHERDGVGGVQDEHLAFFQTLTAVDMGDEGRLPPGLDLAGAKLKREAFERILYDGELHVRPHMATRMPQYGQQNLHGLVTALKSTDTIESDWGEPKSADFDAGHRLAGITGLSCVTCHTSDGYASLGIPGVDLTKMYERLEIAWFRKFLSNPPALREDTRMPAFWEGGKVIHPDIADGTMEGQIDALWAYLSLGESMPLPKGVQADGDAYVLVPIDQPIVHRTFMQDVGPRAIAVGYPQRVHLAFDANQVRLAKLWRGEFYSARGMWAGRGGELLGPLGTDVINLPAGPAVARLEDVEQPWPRGEARGRDIGGKFTGYALDDEQRPTFYYELQGLTVAEKPIPVTRLGGSGMNRRFTLTAGDASESAYLLALRGDAIEELGDNAYRSDAGLTVRLISEDGSSVPTLVRAVDNQSELLVPVQLEAGQTLTIEMELSW
ncbi:MAG: c-type cytochrome [Phycisphaeraceae bacterium]